VQQLRACYFLRLHRLPDANPFEADDLLYGSRLALRHAISGRR